MIDLRAIPTADYIGSIDRQSCTDGVFYAPKHSLGAIVTGPFDTQEDMNQGMLRKFESSEKRPYINFLRTLISATLHDHRTFFTHGDLQLKKYHGAEDKQYIRRSGAVEDQNHRLGSIRLVPRVLGILQRDLLRPLQARLA
jgi:hypothetical protein